MPNVICLIAFTRQRNEVIQYAMTPCVHEDKYNNNYTSHYQLIVNCYKWKYTLCPKKSTFLFFK